jgi:hypothetical protein
MREGRAAYSMIAKSAREVIPQGTFMGNEEDFDTLAGTRGSSGTIP